MENPVIFSYISHCKINLGLSVLNKRNDNFHNLESIFVEVNLFDKLIFKKSDHFFLTSNNEQLVNVANNTVSLAYKKLEGLSQNKQAYSIHLLKEVQILFLVRISFLKHLLLHQELI